MFDTLTPAERQALNLQIMGWMHKFYEVGHALAQSALAAADYTSPVWDHRERYVAARDELNVLHAELTGQAA